MKKILFTLLFISMAFSQFDNTKAGWSGSDFYVPGGETYTSGLIIADKSFLGSESLSETDFATHANWDVTNDFDDTGGNAAFIWTANQTSTLTQTQANLAVAGVSDVWYTLTYTLAITTGFDGDAAATITNSFANTAVPLEIANAGTHTVYFKSKTSPTDFVISLVSGSDTEGTISFDDFSLKQITGGNLFIAGDATLDGFVYFGINAHTEHYKKIVEYNSTETELYLDRGNYQWLTFGAGNIATFDFNYGANSNIIEVNLFIKQDGVGSRTVTTWDAAIDWEGGTPPTLTTTANSTDWLQFVWDGGTVIYGKLLGSDIR